MPDLAKLAKAVGSAGNDISDDALTVRARVTVGGKSLPDTVEAVLVRVVVDCDQRLPDMFELTFLDETFTVLEDAGLDVGAEVEIADGKDGELLVVGEVTAVEAECVETIVYSTARGYDRSHRMQGVRRNRTWLNQSDTLIAKAIAEDAGLRIGVLDQSGTTHEHLGQIGQTDWEFLQHRAAEIGFEASASRGEFSFRDISGAGGVARPRAGFKLKKGDEVEATFKEDLVEFHPSVSGTGLPKSFDAHVWDSDAARVVIGRSGVRTDSVDLEGADPVSLAKELAGSPVKLPKGKPTLAAARLPGPPKVGDDRGTYVVSGLPVAHGPQAQRLADRIAAAAAAQVTSGFAEATGVVVGNPELRPGVRLLVRKVAKVFSGAWTITNARHVFDESDGGYYTHFTASGRQDRSLYGLVSGAGRGFGTKIEGVVCGVVQALDPDNRGRVKVRLPWLAEDFVTDWARTVHTGLGGNAGLHFLPVVGDEVLVAFEQGDPRRPYVLGGVRNEKSPALPGSAPAVVRRGSEEVVVERGIYTPSGAHLVFQDEVSSTMKGPPKQALVRLGGNADQVSLVLDQRRGTVELKSDPVKSDSTAAAGLVWISCGPNGTVDITTTGATARVNVDAGTGGVTVHGSDVTLKGDKSVKIESGGPVTIKGLKIDLN
ncbi:phage baseplate assembly protein V [Umezawaea sp. Da 62-37]|uniref:phage baseplate assembly protein V n=1 Tax=Umezawaea sp. Da 62-37 TaxID=3075927 RepID=UPI0028F74778|nr:phage baseplate assembly protein V [Umezawaea sp. Da 62-37]WNV87978.1 phage baseplate assembly protein V [Umezawaea sp. Da 62-37]